MFIAFYISARFLFFLIILFYIRRHINKNKISSDYFMNEINKELKENSNNYINIFYIKIIYSYFIIIKNIIILIVIA